MIFTRLTALEIMYHNFEIPLVVFIPNITTNHAILELENGSVPVLAGNEISAANLFTTKKKRHFKPAF